MSYHNEIMASVLTDYPEQKPKTHFSVKSDGILQMRFHVHVCANSIRNKEVLIEAVEAR